MTPTAARAARCRRRSRSRSEGPAPLGRLPPAGPTATVISTAGDATLSVSDQAATNVGKLVNTSGATTFAMPQVLQASATSMNGTGRAIAPIGGSAAPTTLLTYRGPVSNDMVALSFQQPV